MANFAPRKLTEEQEKNIDDLKPYIGDESAKKIGKFEENVGGGTPVKGGGRGAMNKDFVIADDPDDPKAIKAKAEGEKVRYRQPRKENGEFTYNSANAKHLYYGKESRGYTKVPFLPLEHVFKKIESDRDDVVIGEDKLSYIFHMKNLSTIEAEKKLRKYVRNSKEENKEDQGFVRKDTLIQEEEATGYEKKKGKKSNAEKEALAQGKTGKIGEKDLDGKYNYLAKNFIKSTNGTSPYFDSDNLPFGKNTGIPNNPNFQPKDLKDKISVAMGKVQASAGLQGKFDAKVAAAQAKYPNIFTKPNKPKPQPKPQYQQPTPTPTPAAPKPNQSATPNVGNNNVNQPNSQQPSMQQSVPKQPKNYSFDEGSKELAAANPKKFYSQNKEAVDTLYNEAQKNGLPISKVKIIQAVSKGHSYDALLKAIQSKKK